jgi:hypothetical protein
MSGPAAISYELPGNLLEFRTVTLPIRAADSVANFYLAMSGIIKWDIGDWPTGGGDWNSLETFLDLDAPLETDDLLIASSATFFAAAVTRAENPILISDTWGIEEGGTAPAQIQSGKVTFEFTSKTYGNAAIPALSFWIDLLLFRPTLVTPAAIKKVHIEGPIWDARESSANVSLKVASHGPPYVTTH